MAKTAPAYDKVMHRWILRLTKGMRQDYLSLKMHFDNCHNPEISSLDISLYWKEELTGEAWRELFILFFPFKIKVFVDYLSLLPFG